MLLILVRQVIPTQFAGVNLGGLSDFRHVFSLTPKVVCGFSRLIIAHNITLGPASLRISATCVHIATLTAVAVWNFNIRMSSAIIHGSAKEAPGLPALKYQ
jgi:hypothetical protein